MSQQQQQDTPGYTLAERMAIIETTIQRKPLFLTRFKKIAWQRDLRDMMIEANKLAGRNIYNINQRF